MRMTQLRPYAGVLSAAAALVVLSGCSDSGNAAANERLTADEAGYRAALDLFTTALSEQDAETVCGFYNAEDTARLVASIGTADCVTGVDSVLASNSDDVSASWASVDVSEVGVTVADDGEYCLDDDDEIPVGEGAWAGDLQTSLPCMVHTGESWVLDDDMWVIEFSRKAT